MSTKVTPEEADMQVVAKRVNDETGGLAVVEDESLTVSGLSESEYIALSAVAQDHGLRKDVGAFDSDTKWRFVPA